MLLDPMGGIVMTNDGNAILREVGPIGESSVPASSSHHNLDRFHLLTPMNLESQMSLLLNVIVLEHGMAVASSCAR